MQRVFARDAVGGGREHGQPFVGYRLSAAFAGAGVAFGLGAECRPVQDVDGAAVDAVAQGLDRVFLPDSHLLGVGVAVSIRRGVVVEVVADQFGGG